MKDKIIKFPGGPNIKKRELNSNSDTYYTLKEMLELAKDDKLKGIIMSARLRNPDGSDEIVVVNSDVNTFLHTQLLSSLQVDYTSKVLLNDMITESLESGVFGFELVDILDVFNDDDNNDEDDD